MTQVTDSRQIDPDFGLAVRLFDELAAATRVGRGIERISYGPGEAVAHRLMIAAAETLGLECRIDAAANLYMTLPGRDRAAPYLMMGSHLDSVRQGGNFDGAAGVVAGLAVLSGFKAAGITPAMDLTVMAIRAEEGAWFDVPYAGSRAAFGLLPPTALDTPRIDTGIGLAHYIAEAGGDPASLARGVAMLDPRRVAAFLEVHIEQAPVLVETGIPVGLVTGIRGYHRFVAARTVGAYGHSGALPRRSRRDAVAATVELLHRLDQVWADFEAAGRDLVFTTGVLTTDSAVAGASKVPGQIDFAIDFRSLEPAVLTDCVELARRHAAEIGAAHRVEMDFGEMSRSQPALLDAGLRERLGRHAAALGIDTLEMPSGAGHDAAVFAASGVPTAMLFVRNENGSHNPDEAMELADFASAVRILMRFCVDGAA
ncbi:MAG TPA: Zn-dependent hydrolase [Stellaceae bacterium]|nr:Zn-dependent hydrolase [Stellaceae bacterium]